MFQVGNHRGVREIERLNEVHLGGGHTNIDKNGTIGLRDFCPQVEFCSFNQGGQISGLRFVHLEAQNLMSLIRCQQSRGTNGHQSQDRKPNKQLHSAAANYQTACKKQSGPTCTVFDHRMGKKVCQFKIP